MKCIKIGIFKLFIFFPLISSALVIDLNKEISPSPEINLFEVLKESEVKKLSPLSKLKYHESRKQWDECLKKSPEVFANNKIIRPWVAQAWLNCALKKFEIQKKSSLLQAPLDVLKQNIAFLDRGPWKVQLTSQWIKAHQFLWEMSQTEKKDKKRLKWQKDLRETLFLRSELLTAEQRIYFAGWPQAGEVNKDRKSWSQDDVNSEKIMELKIQAELEQKNHLKAIGFIVEHLKKFPGSNSHKKLKDKLLELSSEFFEKENSDREKVISLLLDSDPEKLSELASWTHRRAHYTESAVLAEKALFGLKGSSALNSLWVLARSQLFLGQYEKAKKNFTIIAEQYSSTEEAMEALFRLGLLHYRLGNYELAKQNFERVLALNRDKYELNARYWWLRSLEAMKSPNVIEEKRKLISDFPFTYYTLKLKAELQMPLSEESKTKVLPRVKIELFGDQVETWNRIKLLTKSGWLLEAQSELNSLPSPQRADIQIVWADFLLNRQQYPQAIRLINQAMDQDASFKDWSFLKRAFPSIYLDMIQVETKKYSLHPHLIQSLIRQESAFGLKAVSSSNALGLMQMIPPTATDVAKRMSLKVTIPDDMYRPEINIPMGTFYFNSLLEEFKGHVPLALGAYNAGPSRLKTWLKARKDTENVMGTFSTETKDEIWFDELPWNETSFYVKAILRNIILYQSLENSNLELRPGFWSELKDKKALVQ
ncbi:MAG: transglycosylase SLT domain-containing protein [Bdellovibrionota bacterium]